MNLLKDAWINASIQDGTTRRIRPAEIADSFVQDIWAPRPDFRGALFQFLIGLLQTTFAPADWEQWQERWVTPPTLAELDEVFAPFHSAFELDSTGPAFMQELGLDSSEGDEDTSAILGLLVTSSNNAVDKNLDHFVHMVRNGKMCFACTATALFTLQINAPEGGRGNRVSVRGGGPMTTLRLPNRASATVWQKLWLNVVPAQHTARDANPNIFPWTAPTRTSQPQGGIDTTPETAHPLQAFWSMPRRIRLDWRSASPGVCSICGGSFDKVVHGYRSRPHGVNYTGAWIHPLTPYSLDPKQENLPISIKGQPSGIGYRQWLGWTFGDELRRPAMVVTAFARESRALPDEASEITLWCFGYDVKVAKVRCWYDSTLPLPSVAPAAIGPLCNAVLRVLNTAIETASSLHRTVGAATNPEGKCDEAVTQSFWQTSEPLFYRFLGGILSAGPEQNAQVAELSAQFLHGHHQLALSLFDEWVLTVPLDKVELKAIVKARSELERSTWKKSARELTTWINAFREGIA
jgi:CRISPR system Cascade subunit CasA